MDELEVRVLTKSIWSYVFGKRNLFLNIDFQEYPQPLWPACGAASMQLWNRFWLRWDSSAHPNTLAPTQWHDDW